MSGLGSELSQSLNKVGVRFKGEALWCCCYLIGGLLCNRLLWHITRSLKVKCQRSRRS
jgi:hypothetical protein